MPFPRAQFFGLILGLLAAGPAVAADVKPAPEPPPAPTLTLAPLFCDHAVLQRDRPLPIWGHATPGEHLTVAFRGQVVGATAESDGRWIVVLDAVPASAEPADLVVAGKSIVTVRDVLVGEVWLASGQSNMAFKLSQTLEAAKVVPAINLPLVREIDIANTVASAPADTVTTSGWQPAGPTTAGHFSAVGWYFAAELYRKLGVPIGIIRSAWGGTPIESWIDRRALESGPPWPAIDARWQKALAEFPARQAAWPAESAAWAKAEKTAEATHKPNPLPWPPPPVGPGTPYELGGLFNGMIAPLEPYALRGAIWYQGESNWARPAEYADLLPAMIRAWRAQWGEGDFPFYLVQLPNYAQPDDPSGRGWAWLREAQTRALAEPATGLAVTIDSADPKLLHPQNKAIIGRRLAQLAEAGTYGLMVDWSGPTFARLEREGAALRVHFAHASAGLIAANQPPQAFEVAGEDRKFHPATAAIERDTVVVRSPQVPAPVAVRYAWTNAPVANLYNGAGLPAAPFRSDSW